MKITKYYCDICGKEMASSKNQMSLVFHDFYYVPSKKIGFDCVCDECRKDLGRRILDYFTELENYLDNKMSGVKS